ncbi:MAG TPA: PKD domain-containing protein [Candidatus Limnocylindria bacterium]|nr:PKD domain-containing protein [Candidatus Limnocylindria bacterium]
MSVRMLAPAGPIGATRAPSVGASLRLPPRDWLRASWEWDDGSVEPVAAPWASIVRMRTVHRYARPGVYRVRLRVEGDGGWSSEMGERYVVVSGPGQLAASGWIRDPVHRAVPVGLLLTPSDGARLGSALLRCLVPDGELVASDLAWMVAPDPGSVHFGGHARLGTEASSDRPYRVDVALAAREHRGARPHLTVSVYAAGRRPGSDAPEIRVSGDLRPGGIDLGSPG